MPADGLDTNFYGGVFIFETSRTAFLFFQCFIGSFVCPEQPPFLQNLSLFLLLLKIISNSILLYHLVLLQLQYQRQVA